MAPAAAGTELRDVTVFSAVSEPSSISFGSKAAQTYPGSTAWGEIGRPTGTARPLTGLATIQIVPGRLAIDHDPVHFYGFEVVLRYQSPDCTPPLIGTVDWRADSSDYMAVPRVRSEASGGECLARFTVPTSINQWSQLTAFYHDWHTRLVTELWCLTNDPKFYATAARWRRYAEEQKKHEVATTKGKILQPIFEVCESEEDDCGPDQAEPISRNP